LLFQRFVYCRVHLQALSSSSSSKQSVHSQQQPQLQLLGCLPICKLSQASLKWLTHQPELLLAQHQAQLPSFTFPLP